MSTQVHEGKLEKVQEEVPIICLDGPSLASEDATHHKNDRPRLNSFVAQAASADTKCQAQSVRREVLYKTVIMWEASVARTGSWQQNRILLCRMF